MEAQESGVCAASTSFGNRKGSIMAGKKLKAAIPVLCFTAGICLLLYPWVSEYLYENRADSVISTYQSQVEKTDQVQKQEMLEAAHLYNTRISRAQVKLTDPFTADTVSGDEMDYYSVLAIDDSGYMGSIEIPCISLELPVYHGTSADVLEYGIGHLEGSSFPVGGESTHAILSGHTGLNSKKMFTDLVDMEKGDFFFIHILDETLAYEVTEINVVEPSDTSSLVIHAGEDLVTLVTCTPYGVNSHRLLVTGERTEYTGQVHEEELDVAAGASGSLWMKAYGRAILAGIATVAAVGIAMIMFRKFGERRRRA